MSKLSDQRQTPDWLFEELEKEHGPFRVDLCATAENSKDNDFFYIDYLNNQVCYRNSKSQWEPPNTETPGEFLSRFQYPVAAFCNPPYSNPKPFIEKAWEDSKYCKIVLLVKCDPSTQWWATFWNYGERQAVWVEDGKQDNGVGYGHTEMQNVYGPKPGCEVRFLPKRIQFDPPPQLINSGEVWKVGKSGCRYVKTVIL